MELFTDLSEIRRLADKLDNENIEFRTFLKNHDMDSWEIDNIVWEIYAEVSAQIDCTQCGNCCKVTLPVMDQDEIRVFATGLQVAPEDFKDAYLIPAEDEPWKYTFKGTPCPFLEDNRCTNHDFRPESCVTYPHLGKKHFVSRLWNVIENTAICPIAFNVFQLLKDKLWQEDEAFDDEDYWY